MLLEFRHKRRSGGRVKFAERRPTSIHYAPIHVCHHDFLAIDRTLPLCILLLGQMTGVCPNKPSIPSPPAGVS